MARRTKADEEFQRIAEIVRSSSGRSPLYRWLRARHDVFLKLMEEERPTWKTLAEGFAKEGLLSADGKPLSPEAVRHTWWRVRRDVAGKKAKRQPKAKPTVTVIEEPPIPSPAPASPGNALTAIRGRINERSGRKA